MEVQKHLFVIERGIIKELLKLKNERLFSFTKLFALKRSRAPRSGSIIEALFSRVQEFFVGNR